ncbi:hypothetical protein A2311_03180 [candidate division WOR-1 bacterium RIFOXYB2_FULL_48_7]|uniref:Radical SAM core domain-containing protein n=1 Tax=candidate division WOR-1 bacterium RIFOXYB2_FULL_48_7 TaxID=1802583 RepID=A0A1F4TA57_UNCSA|nr:MAG: hypothetical protein A2311_03180 [candidate division WOR-1 bacterium RIFOXYB2_FULL_48_7]
MDSITYQIGDNLYLNITNRCTNECTFCIRNKSQLFNQNYSLWLEREPSALEVLAAIGDPGKYKQIVFCGYGEPLVRLETVKEILLQPAISEARNTIKRIDTNGLANIFWGKNILPELSGLVDYMSISLNAHDAATYQKICRPFYGLPAFAAILDFIKEAKKVVPQVEISVVDLPIVDQAKCAAIAKELGVKLRIRPYYETTYTP